MPAKQNTHDRPRGGETADPCGKKRVFSPDDGHMSDLSELYKIFADTTRLRILCVLLAGEVRVGEISAALSLSPSAVSHQLKILRASKLVRTRREGKSVYYAPADEHVRTILETGMEHVLE